jgi:hypothetical protein
MTLKVPTVGENKLLDDMLKAKNRTLKLFVNDVTPGNADTAATYTEMSTLGYASKSILGANWTIAQNGSNKAEGSFAQQSWTFTAGSAVTIYGYYVVDATDGTLCWAEKFAAGRPVGNEGDQLLLTLKFTGSSEA